MAEASATAAPDILEVTRERLDLGRLVAELTEPACGAVATFSGTVRSPNQGLVVQSIDYQGYDAMILSEMRRLADELHERFDIARIAVVHRLGRLEPAEVSLVIVVSAGHRKPALLACQEALELIKARLPIWKYEAGPDREGYVRGRAEAGPTL